MTARSLVPTTVLVAVAISGAAPRAQAPAQDFSKMDIERTQLASNVYRFEAVGPVLVGNAGILAGPDGVLLVDAQYPQLTDKLVASIKEVSNGRIRFLVNTHHHPDHTSGNANIGAMGATLLARE